MVVHIEHSPIVDAVGGVRLPSIRMAVRTASFRSIALAALTALSTFGAACSESDSTAASGLDASASIPEAGPTAPDTGVDAGFPDSGPPPDVGARFGEVSCAPCGPGCGDGSCLTTQSGESFCADRCDDDVEACIDGFTCLNIGGDGPPAFFCLPPAFTCAAEANSFGARCYDSLATCASPMTFCDGDVVSPGYCTDGCTTDSDCPSAYVCLPGDDGTDVCKPTFVAASETCARGYDPTEVPCALDTDCEPGDLCVRSEPGLPGVCSSPCTDSTDCGEGRCAPTLRGSVCLSDRCGCHALPELTGQRDLLGEALDAVGLTRCSAIFAVHDWTAVAPDVLFDPYRLDFYDEVHNQPLSAPRFGETLVSDVETAAASGPVAARAARMVERFAGLLDRPAVSEPAGALDPAEPLVSAMADLFMAAGETADITALRADAADMSMPLKMASQASSMRFGARSSLGKPPSDFARPWPRGCTTSGRHSWRSAPTATRSLRPTTWFGSCSIKTSATVGCTAPPSIFSTRSLPPI